MLTGVSSLKRGAHYDYLPDKFQPFNENLSSAMMFATRFVAAFWASARV
ncbi:hypothetical protein ALTERO38_50608 [Alteromonas sp. 38]|nr:MULTISPECIES: hypothetical protein [unclassified Alteromonas]CAD5284958.1 hypothetical protein ALTER154_80660 [Alteromonas sp. 154]VXB40127.1 hypothetical protein ALTERO38_50608 [Alteromonas sp. 38]